MLRLDTALSEARQSIVSRDTSDWRQLEQIVIDSCHRKQRWFATDDALRIVGLVARGGGKTTAGKARFALRMLRTPRARCLYIATTREQAESLMWEPLKLLFQQLGFVTNVDVFYNETKLLCRLAKNGATLRLVGADNKRDIDKLRGQPFHEVGIDEAASHGAELLTHLLERIIGPRLGDYNGCIWMIGTPGHLLSGPFYEATRPGGDKHRAYIDRDRDEYADWNNWSSHEWSLDDGAKEVAALASLWKRALHEKEVNGWSDDNPVWLREYLGKWAADDTETVFKYRPHVGGAVWNQWDPERVGPLRIAKLPNDFKDWLHVVAMDEGSSDPFACNVFAFSPSDPSRTVYHTFSFEKRQMYAQPIALLLLGDGLSTDKPGGLFAAIGGWPDGIIMDAGNTLIDELGNVYGIRVVQSDRSTKYKFAAIEVVNGDLIDGRMKILKGSPLELQMMTLQWVTNEFGGLKENKAQANHSTDTLILGRIVIGQIISTNVGPAPEPTRRAVYADPQGLDEDPAGPRNVRPGADEDLQFLTPFDEMWGG